MLPAPPLSSCHHVLTMSFNDTAVTDVGEPAAGPSRTTGMIQKPNGEHVIRVQPLKRSEMQVRASDTRSDLFVRILMFSARHRHSHPMRKTWVLSRYVSVPSSPEARP